MACSGCAARREWINKWMKVARERASNLFAPADPGPAAEADQPARTDRDPEPSTDRGAG
ncbi:hypothetical protein X969_08180 [Pseudomonas monteilii SB3078]|nr:hypothetical protein X969_08180 [Pseudomonas monteilii SB3078]